MGPMSDEDDSAVGTAPEMPVKSESQSDTGAGAEGGGEAAGVEERLAPGIEEAGYGYGV